MADHALTTTNSGLVLPDVVYTVFKWIAQILLPAAGALYAGLSGYWGFPKPVEVVGTISLVDVFLGVVIGISSIAYNNSGAGVSGTLVASTDPDTGVATIHSLVSTVPAAQLAASKTVTLKVVPPTETTLTAPTPVVGD